MARRKKLKEIRIGVFGLQRGLGFVKHMQRIKGVKLDDFFTCGIIFFSYVPYIGI